MSIDSMFKNHIQLYSSLGTMVNTNNLRSTDKNSKFPKYIGLQLPIMRQLMPLQRHIEAHQWREASILEICSFLPV